MTYDEAKKKILTKWTIGIPIVVIASVSSAISALKMFYFGLDGRDPLSHAFFQPIKQLVEMSYRNTHFLEYFWLYSPVPTPNTILAGNNIYFLVGYLCIFLGMAFIGSARSLSARLAAIDKQIADEMIKASVTGSRIRQRQEIQSLISVQKSGFFSQFHTLYLAPLIVGVLVAAIAKLTGLV